MSSQLDYEINKELGECYLFMGEMDKAEEYYLKAVNSNGVHFEPYLGLATVAVQRGDLDRAMVFYKKAHDIEATDKSLSGIALIQMERGDKAGAFDLFSQAVDKNPENMVALFSLLRLAHELERLSEVLPRLEACLEVDPGRHEVRYALAGCLVCLDRRKEAAGHLERIVGAEPSFAPAQELLDQIRK
ncbi:MAG: tetratricopeptide repeat protein [Desulfovibrionaceae bacterium]|nr:tetratricopeptide repeat protein [Desulfovibrionaceae bacterium]